MSDGPSLEAWTEPSARAVLREIFDAGVASADPGAAVLRHLPDKPSGRCVVVGAGKASVAMAAAMQPGTTSISAASLSPVTVRARRPGASRCWKPRIRRPTP